MARYLQQPFPGQRPVGMFSKHLQKIELGGGQRFRHASAYNLGVNAYVVKPVAFDKFVEVVKQIGLFWVLTNEVPTQI